MLPHEGEKEREGERGWSGDSIGDSELNMINLLPLRSCGGNEEDWLALLIYVVFWEDVALC